VDVFPDYLGPVQEALYDRIVIGDAIEWLAGQQDKSFDLVAVLDMIEHLERDQAMRLRDEARRVGRTVIISTPDYDYPQEAIYGNAAEIHRSVLRAVDFPGAIVFEGQETITAVYAPEEAMPVIRRIRRKNLFPDWFVRRVRSTRNRGG
jgi:2-polyprenyl-3-methyl-5-hydroxy-6-metoxy-1,4-benzoquinol methylase